jgi:Family of unknown function (DUF6370)
MRGVFILFFFHFFLSGVWALGKEMKMGTPDSTKKIQVVEASCGMCQLGLPGKSCALAVRINGRSYYVDGTDIDSYGNAHSKHGFCNAIRKAEVQGEIVNDRFKLTYFKLLPARADKVDKTKMKNTP